MNIIEPSYKIESAPSYADALLRVEAAGRVCYKSEGKVCEGSAERLVVSLISRGHESVLEHYSITVRFIADRAFTHELVRHRLASFSQESQRYVRYEEGIEFVKPHWMKDSKAGLLWMDAMRDAEIYYLALLSEGWKPEQARCVLPNSTKTEIVMTANLREWRHILRLRTARSAHPQMRELMRPLLNELKERLPAFFADISFGEK